MAEGIKAFVVDPDGDVRHWLGRLLDHTAGFRCVGGSSTLGGLAGSPPAETPDVILVDVQQAVANPDHLRTARERYPAAKLVLMELEEGARYETLAGRFGADAFLSKARAPESLASLRNRFFEPDSGDGRPQSVSLIG